MGGIGYVEVAVTGATGFVGRHAVRELDRRGFRVRALVRDTTKADQLLPERVQRIVGDITDPASLNLLLDGADAIIHTVGLRREIPPEMTFARLHVGATRALVETAEAHRVERLIHVSALGVRANAPTEYQRSKYEAERIVRRSGLDWTILRPSIIHGADGEFIRMVRDWVLGRAAPRSFLPYFASFELDRDARPPRPRLVSALIQPVHVDDVARALAECLGHQESVGEIYPITGAEILEWPDMLEAIRDAMPLTDHRKRPRPIPAPLCVLVARAAEALGIGAALPFGPSEPAMAAENSVAPHAKAREQLGIEPLGFHEALRSYADSI